MANEPEIGHAFRMHPDDHLPGEPARHTGEYQQLNVFGTPTGWNVYTEKDKPLPSSPRGFTWRHVTKEDCQKDGAPMRQRAEEVGEVGD